MPWIAWIAIVGIIVFGITQIVSMATGRPLPGGSRSDEIKHLERRIKELERAAEAGQIEGRVPTKAEENLAAEDRWRLDMLEARLEELERRGGDGADDDGPETSQS
ncbi:hypothetical protein [Nesterenkonia sp.]|uniref:hypothetical protein n=1 Tax=Nesterenkonia sp. TaxID=704201 RepID=UPI002617A5D5|nr:hypothetical protein [Nesterenkonia sp.]